MWLQQDSIIIINNQPLVKISHVILIWGNSASLHLGIGLGLERLTINSLSCHSVPAWCLFLVLLGLLPVEGILPLREECPVTALSLKASAGAGFQVKATGYCSEHYSATTDSVLKVMHFPCGYQGRKQYCWIKSILLYIHAVVSWDMGGKWVNSLHKRASSGILPAPCFSCSNTNMSANYLLNPYKASCISNRQISALVWCFYSLTGCGHFKAAKSLHCHPPPCSCSACTVKQQRQGKGSALVFTPKSCLLLYLSTMITHRWRVQLFLDVCLAPASWRKLSTYSQHIPQQCLFATVEHGWRTEPIPEDVFVLSNCF